MNKNLDDYNRMRDFRRRRNPSPSNPRSRKKTKDHALQFCIQKHDASRLHYDFRLELDGALKSWAVPKGPSLDPKVKRLAVHVEDHPLDYATFEGSIPEGHYGAGDVIVWDRGVWIPQDDPAKAYAKGRLKFELQGEKLGGLWNLVRTHMPGKQEQWFLIKHQDGAARPESDYDVVGRRARQRAQRTNDPGQKNQGDQGNPSQGHQAAGGANAQRNVKQKSAPLTGARKARLPDQLKPELATLVEKAPGGRVEL